MEEDDVRKADEIIKESLIIPDEVDQETEIALQVSHREYFSSSYDELSNNENLFNALKISDDDYCNELIEKLIVKEMRIKSLEMFCKKIKGLSFTKEDILIKNYLENILEEYFNSNIDFIFIENEMYEKIYKIIDSYYLIPIEKKKGKTFISYDEDLIIRSIFRKS